MSKEIIDKEDNLKLFNIIVILIANITNLKIDKEILTKTNITDDSNHKFNLYDINKNKIKNVEISNKLKEFFPLFLIIISKGNSYDINKPIELNIPEDERLTKLTINDQNIKYFNKLKIIYFELVDLLIKYKIQFRHVYNLDLKIFYDYKKIEEEKERQEKEIQTKEEEEERQTKEEKEIQEEEENEIHTKEEKEIQEEERQTKEENERQEEKDINYFINKINKIVKINQENNITYESLLELLNSDNYKSINYKYILEKSSDIDFINKRRDIFIKGVIIKAFDAIIKLHNSIPIKELTLVDIELIYDELNKSIIDTNYGGGKAILRNHKLKYLLKKIYKDIKILSLN
jgi:flagellar biosynthesis GTPase FlhF